MKKNSVLTRDQTNRLKDSFENSNEFEKITLLINKLNKKINKLIYLCYLDSNDKCLNKQMRKDSKLLKELHKTCKKKLIQFNDLNSFYNYSSQNTQGQFYHDVLDDLDSAFVRGNSKLNNHSSIDSPILALTQFKPLASDGFVKGKHPFKALSKRVYVLPIEQVNTSFPHLPIAPNPFQPYELWGNSVSKFIYKGDRPAYVQITGSLSIFVKLYNVTPEQHRYSCKAPFSAPELWCEFLLPNNKPKIERSFRRGLAMDTAPLGKALFKMEDDTISLHPHPKNYYDFYKAIEAWNNNQSTPIDLKKIVLYPKVLLNHKLECRLGEAIPVKGYHMTDWFLLPPCLCFTTNTDGTSSVIQIQYRDSYNKVWFYPLGKNINSANQQLFTIPSQARYARIFFSNIEDTAKKLEVNFFPKEIDPTYGMWSHYQLDINSFYTFYPNTPFQIVLRFYGGNYFSVDSQSFFINSGGLQCFIDVREQLSSALNVEEERNGN